jgi:tetratricopeptide (TPR) repeat protein
MQAAEWFSKALIANPHCGPSLRTSIGLCYYKLQQFERASQSSLRAISLESMDSTALILMGLVDLSEADKSHPKRKDLRRSAFDCFSLANRLDPTNPVIWNLLANQYYHSWFPFECITPSSFIGNDTVVINVRAPASIFVAGNNLRFGSHKDSFLVREVVEYPSEENDGSQVFKIVLDGLVPSRIMSDSFTRVMINNLILATSLVNNALNYGLSDQVKAESHYILGKIRLHQKNLLGAMESYKAALKEKADFGLAAFGLAEIQFFRMEYKPSLEIFEKLLHQHPTDKDTQAYVSLLKGMLKNEQTSMDKLKEVAINFQFDLELWKVQGFVRHNHSGRDSLEDALRCYQNCLDCYQSRGLTASPEILNNVAQIFFLLGKPEKSIRFIKEAISSLSEYETQPLPARFSLETDFENFTYTWEETNVQLLCTPGVDGEFTVEAGELNNCGLVAGSEIMIGDVIVEIEEVMENSLKCHSIFSSYLSGSVSHHLRVKRIVNCFGPATVNYWFNLSTYLEAMRMFRSARLIYETILSFYPSFDECHARIAVICRSVGNLEGALQALNAGSGNSHPKEFNIIKGDILLVMGRPEEAKRSYEANVDKNQNTAKDQSLVLSLGNLYMNAHDPKISYKYFYGLLQEHDRNIYAANGLGIACVKRGEFESAKQIFHKIRQFGMGNDEKMFSLNLAHTALLEGKYLEAERLYIAAYKDDCRRSDRDSSCSYANLEHAGCASFLSNRLEDAAKFCLRSMHANLSKQTLANSSIVLEKFIARTAARLTDQSPVLTDLVRFCRQFLKAGALQKSTKNNFADRLKIMEIILAKLTNRQATHKNEDFREDSPPILGKRKFEE